MWRQRRNKKMENVKMDVYELSLALRRMAKNIDPVYTEILFDASNQLSELKGDNTHLISQNNKLKSEITKLKSNGS